MISLTITLVSILLVVVLALAAIYYGGDIASRAASKAAATTLINQAAQISNAGQLAELRGTGWPVSHITFSTDYLTKTPTPPTRAYAGTLTATSSDWEYYIAETHHFVLRNKIKADVCFAVNEAQGLIGIPATLSNKQIAQCYGVSEPYTFYYNPSGTTAAQTNLVVTTSISEVNQLINSNPLMVKPNDDLLTTDTSPLAVIQSPGWPIKCPSGSWISAGLCRGDVGRNTIPVVPTGPSAPSGGFVKLSANDNAWLYSDYGVPADAQHIIITNDGDTVAQISAARIATSANGTAGDGAKHFIQSSTCEGSLAPGQTCDFTVASDGQNLPGQPVSATFGVDVSNGGAVQWYPLGLASADTLATAAMPASTGPLIWASQSQITLSAMQGVLSEAQSITISNGGTAAAIFSEGPPKIESTAAGAVPVALNDNLFQQSTDCQDRLEPGESCNVRVWLNTSNKPVGGWYNGVISVGVSNPQTQNSPSWQALTAVRGEVVDGGALKTINPARGFFAIPYFNSWSPEGYSFAVHGSGFSGKIITASIPDAANSVEITVVSDTQLTVHITEMPLYLWDFGLNTMPRPLRIVFSQDGLSQTRTFPLLQVWGTGGYTAIPNNLIDIQALLSNPASGYTSAPDNYMYFNVSAPSLISAILIYDCYLQGKAWNVCQPPYAMIGSLLRVDLSAFPADSAVLVVTTSEDGLRNDWALQATRGIKPPETFALD